MKPKFVQIGEKTTAAFGDEEHLQDRFDVAKLTVDVNEEIRKLMGRDYVLAKLSEQQKTFIVEQVKVAIILHQLFARLDSSIADSIKDTILTETQAICLLERNKQDNNLVKWVLEVPDEQQETEHRSEQAKNVIKELLTPQQ